MDETVRLTNDQISPTTRILAVLLVLFVRMGLLEQRTKPMPGTQ